MMNTPLELSYIPYLSLLKKSGEYVAERFKAGRPALLTLEPGDATRYQFVLVRNDLSFTIVVASLTGGQAYEVTPDNGPYDAPKDMNPFTSALVSDIIREAHGRKCYAFYPKMAKFDEGFERDMTSNNPPMWGPSGFMRKQQAATP